MTSLGDFSLGRKSFLGDASRLLLRSHAIVSKEDAEKPCKILSIPNTLILWFFDNCLQ